MVQMHSVDDDVGGSAMEVPIEAFTRFGGSTPFTADSKSSLNNQLHYRGGPSLSVIGLLVTEGQ